MYQLHKRMRPLLGTFVEVALFSTDENAADAFERAFTRIELIQNLLSFHQHDSDLTRLNRARGQWVDCHPLSIQCLRLARAATRTSGGVFNCTLGAAVVKNGALPAQDFADIYGTQLMSLGNWQDIELTAKSARLHRPVLITLDGIAKGFAVDSALAELKACGIGCGWINAGGDIRVYGEHVLPVAVRDHEGREHSLGGLRNVAIATSTTAATEDHPGLLLDARANPLPVETISVISTSAWRADALTKVAAGVVPAERADAVARLGGRLVLL